VLENRKMGLKEKVIRDFGDKLGQMANPRGCFLATLYEPELSTEMIQEMLDNQ